MRIPRLVPAALALASLSGCGLVSQAATPGRPTAPRAAGTTAPSAPADAAAAPGTAGADTPVPVEQDVPKVMTSGAHDVPYLAADIDGSWKQVVKDQNGTDRWQQSSTGCQFALVNSHESHPSDVQGTTEALRQMADGMTSQFPAARLRTQPNVIVRRTGARPVEFAVRRMDITPPGTTAQTATYFGARTLAQDQVGLGFVLSCPTKVVTAHPDLPTRMAGRTHIASAVAG